MILFRGIAASPGTATGPCVLSLENAKAGAILFCNESSPEDTPAIQACAAVVTTRGGITADAAIVARTLGKPCVVSCSGVRIDFAARAMFFVLDGEERSIKEGELVTVDGATGTVSG